jgi:hypothetical protein
MLKSGNGCGNYSVIPIGPKTKKRQLIEPALFGVGCGSLKPLTSAKPNRRYFKFLILKIFWQIPQE